MTRILCFVRARTLPPWGAFPSLRTSAWNSPSRSTGLDSHEVSGLQLAFGQQETRGGLAHAVLAGAMKLQANVCCPLLSVLESSHGLMVNLRWIVGYATYLPWTVMVCVPIYGSGGGADGIRGAEETQNGCREV